MSDNAKDLYRKRISKPVEENPYMEALMQKIQRGNKTTAVVGQSMDLMDSRTGELVKEAMPFIGVRKEVDKTTFVKMYQDGIRQTFGSPRYALGVLEVLFNAYRDERSLSWSDKIYMNYKAAVRDYGYSFKQQTYIRGMNYLLDNDFIAASVQPNIYFINPLFFLRVIVSR